MRIFISADMEGITGVTAAEDCTPDTPGWERFRKLMTADVNAAIAGAREAGANEVIVCDGHSSMRNLVIEELDQHAFLARGRIKTYAMMEGASGSDLAFMIGYHAPAGDVGVLSHTWLGASITDVRLNGDRCSEGRMNAILAGSFGVPVGMITGDDRTSEDAKTYMPHALRVTVKTALDRFSAICLPPERSQAMIRDAAARAVRNVASFPVLRLEPPYAWEVNVVGVSGAKRASFIPSVERIGDRSVRWTLDDYQASYRLFQAVAALVNLSSDPTFG